MGNCEENGVSFGIKLFEMKKFYLILFVISSCSPFDEKKEEDKRTPTIISSEKIDSLSQQIDTLFPDYNRREIDTKEFKRVQPIDDYIKNGKDKSIEVIVSGYDTSYTIDLDTN